MAVRPARTNCSYWIEVVFVFIFPCPECGKGVAVEEEMAGVDKLCPYCKAEIRVPEEVPGALARTFSRRLTLPAEPDYSRESTYGWYSLLFGFSSLVFTCFLSCGGIPFSLIALGLGCYSLGRGVEKGWGIAGVALALLSLGLFVLMIVNRAAQTAR